MYTRHGNERTTIVVLWSLRARLLQYVPFFVAAPWLATVAAPRLPLKARFQFERRENIAPNKRSFRGPGDVVRDLGLYSGTKICVRELASVVSRGLPLTTRRTIYIVPKLLIPNQDQYFNVLVCRL